MEHPGNWVLGACSAILGVAGLFVSARVGEGVGYYGGLAIFAAGILFTMYLIKSSFDAQENGH